MTPDMWGFTLLGIGSQVVLTAFFGARHWARSRAMALGRAAYVAGGLGLPVGIWLAMSGESPRYWLGPLLLAAWAAFGAAVDLWRKIPWRVPIRPSVLVPYVALYFFAQMFLWWPLRDVSLPAWAVFGLLFVASTTLNLTGHFGVKESAS